MNPAIESTVAFLMKDTIRPSLHEEIPEDSYDIVEALMDEEVKQPFGPDSDFRGLIIARYFPDGKLTVKSSDSNRVFTDIDKKALETWFKARDHKPYVGDFFRLSIAKVIVMFKSYSLNGSRVMVGHMLSNTPMVKLDLLEAKQNYLTRKFL